MKQNMFLTLIVLIILITINNDYMINNNCNRAENQDIKMISSGPETQRNNKKNKQ